MNGPGHLGYGELRELREIWMINFKGISGFDGLISSQELERVTIMTSSIKDLTGIGNHPRLTSLALHNNHSLRDISGLAEVKASLTTLAIDCCVKIRDFSVLEQLENLEFLQLDGNNTLPNLNFLRRMPRLKCFSFTMNVADGDLRPCLNIPQAYCRDRKHFNLKNNQLPKAQT
jgi:Leucine-rich repeat (LRR) protein